MMADIIIGRKRNNIIWKLKKSRIAKILLLLSWIYLYKLFGEKCKEHPESIFIIGGLGVMLVNLMYIPVRIVKHRKVHAIFRSSLPIILMLLLVMCFKDSLMILTANFIEKFAYKVVYSFVVIMVLVALIKTWKVHAKKSTNYICQKDYDCMEGHEFEYFCSNLLRKRGFSRVQVTQGSGDYGIDIIAWKNGVKYGIQCKRYSGTVGWHAVEEAYAGAVYYGCDKAVVITNSQFTKQAVNGAERIGVFLWDKNWIEKNHINN